MTGERYWERRRDLEGGKQLGIWLLKDCDEVVHKELVVETHEYRNGMFDVHEVIDAEWEKLGDFKTANDAFAEAKRALSESTYEIQSGTM